MAQMKGKTLGKLSKLKLTPEQADKAFEYGRIKKTDGGYQGTFREITGSIRSVDGDPTAHVYDVVLNKIKGYANRDDGGTYQQWCRDVLTANGIGWP